MPLMEMEKFLSAVVAVGPFNEPIYTFTMMHFIPFSSYILHEKTPASIMDAGVLFWVLVKVIPQWKQCLPALPGCRTRRFYPSCGDR